MGPGHDTLHSTPDVPAGGTGAFFSWTALPNVKTLLARQCCTHYGGWVRLSKTRVLLADDNIQVLEYVRDFLSGNCCEVVSAVTDGEAAVRAAAQLLPDVVVLDLSMPVLNGIEAAKRMLEANPSTKVVFLTVEKDRATCSAALEAGACGYVLKPRLAADLIPAIKLATGGRRFVSAGCE